MKKHLCRILAAVLLLASLNGCSLTVPTVPGNETLPENTSRQTEAPETTPAGTQAQSTPAPTLPPATEPPATEPPATEPPAPEPPATEPAPPETSEVPPAELSAPKAYAQALAALPQDYHVEMTLQTVREIDLDTLLVTDEWVMDVKAAGTDSMTAHILWTRTVENDVIYPTAVGYELCYSKGRGLLISEDRAVLTEQDAESFLAAFPPLALLTADKYESVEWTDEYHSGIAFSEAVDTGWEWIGMDCTDITEAEGLALFDENGALSGFEYEAEFALEGIAVYAAAEMRLSPLTEEIPMLQPGGQLIRVSDLRIVPLMDLAGLYTKMESFSSGVLAVYQMGIAGTAVLKQEWLAADRSGGDLLLLDHAYLNNYTAAGTETNEIDFTYIDGELRYVVNEEEQEVGATLDEFCDSILDYLHAHWIWPGDLADAVLSDEEDCWLIEFSLGASGIDAVRGRVEEDLWSEKDYLANLGARFQAGECTGCLSIDKGSGMPLHLKIDLEGTHQYQRMSYPMVYAGEWTFQTDNAGVYNLITDEVRPSEVPAEPATPLFYKVTAPNGRTMWLLGTIHIGDERTAHLPQEIYDALLGSDALAVEIDVTDMETRLDEDEALLEAYQAATYYLDNSTAYDHLGETVAEKLTLALKKYGGDIRLNWLSYNVTSLTSLIEQLILEMGRLESYDRGVDNQLVKLAKDNGIEVWDVEDFAEHIMLLSNYSEPLQELILEETLDAGRYASNLGSHELFEAWCRGDEAELTGELNDEEEEEDEELTPEEQAMVDEYNEAMLRKRNAEMVEKAKEYMEGDKTVFFAVGLAHLLAEDGLVPCLREAGYTVEQVVYAP